MRKFGRKRLPAAYRYTEALGPEEWAWEFLRRDPDYRTTTAALGPAHPPADGQDAARRWGLSFRRASRAAGR